MDVRPARPAEAHAWEQLRQELWPSAPREHAREVAAFFARDRQIRSKLPLAIDGEEVVGFAEVSIRSFRKDL